MADTSITASAVVPSAAAVIEKGIAGATIAAGETVYRDSTTALFQLADGNDATKMPVKGIAVNSASAGQPLSVVKEDPALTIGTHGVALGTPLFQSPNAGKVCPFADLAAGNLTTPLMVVRSTTTVAFGIIGGFTAIPA